MTFARSLFAKSDRPKVTFITTRVARALYKFVWASKDVRLPLGSVCTSDDAVAVRTN